MSNEGVFIVAQPVENCKILIVMKIIHKQQLALVYTERFEKSGDLSRREKSALDVITLVPNPHLDPLFQWKMGCAPVNYERKSHFTLQ